MNTGADQRNSERTAPAPPAPRHPLSARLLSALSRLLAVAAILGLAFKSVGEVISDRYWWSQWLEWTPNILVWCGTLVVLVFSTAFTRLADRIARGMVRARWIGRSAWVLLLVYTGYTIVVDAPFYRRAPRTPGSLDDSTRLVFWNAAADEKEGWQNTITAAQGDIVILEGLTSHARLQSILDTMPPGSMRLLYDRFVVLSALPIRRFGFTLLNIPAGAGWDPRLPEGIHAQRDPGAAIYLEIGPKREGDPARVLWIIDLPSDPTLPRWDITRYARAAIDNFQGERRVRTPDGHWTVDHAQVPPGFPVPDLIVGDFNIPRGAESLSHLRCGYPDAFDQAATGYMASWPRLLPRIHRQFPLLHLDQVFLRPGLRAWRYKLEDVGCGAHLMQVVDVTDK